MIIIGKRDFFQMRTISESLMTTEFIFESVFEKHMQMIINQFNKFGSRASTKKFFSELGFMVDSIDASRVRVYEFIDSTVIKSVMKAVEDKTKILFGIRYWEGETLVAFAYIPRLADKRNEDPFRWLPTKSGKEYGTWSCYNENIMYNYKEYKKSKMPQMWAKCDEIWVIDTKGLGTAELQRDRRNAKYGVWENTPEFYAEVAKKNLERYQQLKAKMNISSGKEFEKLIEEMNKLTDTLYTLLTDLSKHMKIGDWGQNTYISDEIFEFNSSCQYAMRTFNDLLRQQREYEESKKYKGSGIFSGEYYVRSYRQAVEDLKDRIDRAWKQYEVFQDHMAKWQKGALPGND